jgi:hypothetical protein
MVALNPDSVDCKGPYWYWLLGMPLPAIAGACEKLHTAGFEPVTYTVIGAEPIAGGIMKPGAGQQAVAIVGLLVRKPRVGDETRPEIKF